MEKPIAFISHITEEKQIALALKELLRSAFLGMIDIFVSSDPTNMRLGSRWLDEIHHALKACAVEIIIASPESVKRPWINFEAGAVWIREQPVIPLCHSGMTFEKLPAPLNALQSALATEEPSLQQIVPILARSLGCEEPNVDFSPFVKVVQEFENVTRENAKIVAASPVVLDGELAHHEIAALSTIASIVDAPSDRIYPATVKKQMTEAGFYEVACTLALQILERRGFVEFPVEVDRHGEEFNQVTITENGWDWLQTHQSSLTLTGREPPIPF